MQVISRAFRAKKRCLIVRREDGKKRERERWRQSFLREPRKGQDTKWMMMWAAHRTSRWTSKVNYSLLSQSSPFLHELLFFFFFFSSRIVKGFMVPFHCRRLPLRRTRRKKEVFSPLIRRTNLAQRGTIQRKIAVTRRYIPLMESSID